MDSDSTFGIAGGIQYDSDLEGDNDYHNQVDVIAQSGPTFVFTMGLHPSKPRHASEIEMTTLRHLLTTRIYLLATLKRSPLRAGEEGGRQAPQTRGEVSVQLGTPAVC